MLAVPLFVALGVPVLSALAAAQVQSIVIAGVGSLGYLAAGTIDWPLAVLVGVPELAGVLLGWRIARAVPARDRFPSGCIRSLRRLVCVRKGAPGARTQHRREPGELRPCARC